MEERLKAKEAEGTAAAVAAAAARGIEKPPRASRKVGNLMEGLGISVLETAASFANLTYSSRALMAASVNLTRTTLFFALCSLLVDGVVVVADDASPTVAFCSSD